MFKKKQFSLTDEQYNLIQAWAGSHECKYEEKTSHSCVGGEISIIFTPTSIGTGVKARCICGKEMDLTSF